MLPPMPLLRSLVFLAGRAATKMPPLRGFRLTRQRLGLRRCSAAFSPATNGMSKAIQDAIKAMEAAFQESQLTDHVYGVRAGSPPIAPWPNQPCRLVFLDFDGVLNSIQSTEHLGTRYRFAPASVSALNELLRQSQAQVVITSTWRESWTLRENAEFLERDGVVSGRVVGKTPALGQERGLEIDAWLRSAPYPVMSFVILDDRDDMAMHRNRLVQVNPQVGLSSEQAERAIELLAMPWRKSA